MDKERIIEFGEICCAHESLVELAYERVYQSLADIGHKGEELEASAEMALFNVLGSISGSTDIWSVLIRGNLAVELCEKFEPLSDYVEDFNCEDIDEMADEILEEWYGIKNSENTEQIEADIREYGLGYAPYAGPYENWEEAKHACPFEYCIETFPLNEDSEISCQIFAHICPGEIKIDDQNKEDTSCILE